LRVEQASGRVGGGDFPTTTAESFAPPTVITAGFARGWDGAHRPGRSCRPSRTLRRVADHHALAGSLLPPTERWRSSLAPRIAASRRAEPANESDARTALLRPARRRNESTVTLESVRAAITPALQYDSQHLVVRDRAQAGRGHTGRRLALL
jgi:hypothetical protein